MTIKVKLGDLVASDGALRELGAMTGVPQKTAYRLARVIRKSADDVKLFNERRLEIMRETGKLEPHPGVPGQLWLDPRKITVEDSDRLSKGMKELEAVEVEIEAMPIKLSEFGERVDLRPNWLADLTWLIVEE